MITKRKSFRILLYFALPAILIVGAQLVSYPLLTSFYGHIGLNEIIILIIVYLSIVVGETRILPHRILSRAGLVCGCVYILLGIFFSEIILVFIKKELLRHLLTALFLIYLFISGQILLTCTYQRDEFHKNYTIINLIAFIVVLGGTFLLPTIGFGISLVILGALLCLMGLNKEYSNDTFPKKSLTINRESTKSLLFGMISAGYISCYFRTVYMGLFPTGYEFNIYLALTFLMLTFATVIHQKLNKRSLQLSTESLVYVGLLFNILLIVALFGGPGKNTFFFDPYKFFISTNHYWQYYWAYVLIFCSVLYLPYIFFAAIIPARESEARGINHLFFCSLGNLFGLIIFGLLLIDMNMGLKLSILFSGAGILFLYRHGFRSMMSLWAFALMLAACALLPTNLDERLVAQAQRMYPVLYKLTQSSNHSVETIQHLTKKRGAVAYIYKNDQHARLGFGGYTASTKGWKDFVRARTVKGLIDPDTKKILFLGLGNQAILQEAYSRLKMLNINDFKIDIVDNFYPFFMDSFKSAVEEEIGFDFDVPEIKLHYSDAFQYLAEVDDDHYDLIVWNLSWPNYLPVAKLITQEGSHLFAKALKPNGLFIGPYYADNLLNCSLVSAFQYFRLNDKKMASSYGSIIATNALINNKSKMQWHKNALQAKCKNIQPLNLNNHLKARNFFTHNYYVRKNVVFDDFLD